MLGPGKKMSWFLPLAKRYIWTWTHQFWWFVLPLQAEELNHQINEHGLRRWLYSLTSLLVGRRRWRGEEGQTSGDGRWSWERNVWFFLRFFFNKRKRSFTLIDFQGFSSGFWQIRRTRDQVIHYKAVLHKPEEDHCPTADWAFETCTIMDVYISDSYQPANCLRNKRNAQKPKKEQFQLNRFFKIDLCPFLITKKGNL